MSFHYEIEINELIFTAFQVAAPHFYLLSICVYVCVIIYYVRQLQNRCHLIW